jgi:hypothetical protein
MEEYRNPFEYEAASKLTPHQLLEYYIEDFNYSRFVRSKRNVFLVGERGTGKTMALRYHSLPVYVLQQKKKDDELDLSIISVYVPCNTPLTHRREYELLDQLNASLSSEHFLVLSIMDRIIESLSEINEFLTSDDEDHLRGELSYLLNLEIPVNVPFFRALRLAFGKSSSDAQRALNTKTDAESSLRNLLSFTSGLLPLLTCLAHLPKLSNSHFSLMLDDVQYFNPYQIKAMNSWISYRDNSLFSFKVATTRVEYPTLETSSGGCILEGHDFTRLDMEQPYQNKTSAFAKMAREIISRRLATIAVGKTPEEYFPLSAEMAQDIENAEAQAREEADEKFPTGTTKQKDDYIYKYARAIYFRNRASKANLPPYSGFEVLVHMSTGVIRNLLDPCYYMYDAMYSQWHAESREGKPIFDSIPSSVQTQVILSRSTKKWELTKGELDKTIDDCSREDARRVYQLLDNLAILFRARLLSEISEPRAVSFTISNFTHDLQAKLEPVLTVARKAQLIYVYTSSGKDLGRREVYYMPNRMLWPVRGLDPIGQHARVSIRAEHLWNAADKNKKIPFNEKEEIDEPTLFDFT